MHEAKKKYNQTRNCKDTSVTCYAPFCNMHLTVSGAVTTCGLRRLTPIGNYPEESLQEIWFGKKANALRASMLSAKFPHGCGVCSKSIETAQFSLVRALQFDSLSTHLKRNPFYFFANSYYKLKDNFPKSIDFELSNLCNLECAMCFGMLSSGIRKNREKLPPLEDHYSEKLLNELKIFIPHLKEARFFGGEPLLIPLYEKIWELIVAINPNCIVWMKTNGTILNNRVKQVLNRLINVNITISLDAITPSIYEIVRKNGKLQSVLDNIDFFKQLHKKQNKILKLSPTIMVHNWEDYPLLIKYANENECIVENNLLITPWHLALANQEFSLLKVILTKWNQQFAAIPLITTIEKKNALAFTELFEQVKTWTQMREKQIKHRYGAYFKLMPGVGAVNKFILAQFDNEIRLYKDPETDLIKQQLIHDEIDFIVILNALFEIIYLFTDTNKPDRLFNMHYLNRLKELPQSTIMKAKAFFFDGSVSIVSLTDAIIKKQSYKINELLLLKIYN